MENFKFLTKYLILLIIVICLGILSWAYLNFVRAQNTINPERTITLTAEGRVFAKPDIVKLTFSVITQGKSASEVQKENDKRVNDLIDYIKKEGILKEDIKTINYLLDPQYDYSWCKKNENDSRICPPKIEGYQLVQTVEVKIRDFDKINKIVGALTEKGANEISGIVFEVEDLENYKNLARIEAIKKIEKRAKLISEQTSVKLGKIINISESGIYPPVYRTAKSALESAGAPEPLSQTQIEPGLREITVNLSISYEIK